jgi:hypothetical protein
VEVSVSDAVFVAVGRGDIAQSIALVNQGDTVDIEGTLVPHEWRAGDGTGRLLATIEATKVTPCQQQKK